MEVDFDKEMDALLRQSVTRGVLVGDKPKVHLDADAIAAFAENAVPEKSRIIYTQHLAECDPCRKTLSNLITLNAAAEPAFAAAAAPIVSSVPWYRKLFAAPNLAYVMGGLVLVFGGLFGFMVLQNSYFGDNVTVSQVQDTEMPASAPVRSDGSSASAANASANTNSVSNAPGEIPRAVGTAETESEPNLGSTTQPSATAPADAPVAAPPPAKEPAVDGLDKTAPPAGQPMMKEAPKLAKDEAAKVEEKRAVNDQEAAKKGQDYDNKGGREAQQNQVQMMPNAATKSAGPSRNEMQRDNRVYKNDDSSLRAKQAENSASTVGGASNVRTAGGKKFEQKQGAWYDTSYRGQGTKNVRRGTSEYRDLDSGLRSIAESIGGTVVVVWNGKAYRIQ